MIIVKTDKEYRFNVTVTLPRIGTRTPDQKGEFEIEDNELEAATTMCQLQPDFYIVSEAIVPNVEPNDLNESEEDELNEVDEDDKKLFIESLSSKTKAQLVELCKPFPRKEWSTHNKEELITYLSAKL